MFQAKDYRGLSRLSGIQKHRFVREGQMNPCRINVTQQRDGPFQFPFECPLIVDLLGEIAGAEIGSVKEFEADSSGTGHASAGQRETGLCQTLRGDEDGCAGFIKAVLNTGFPHLCGDGGCVLRCQAGI